MAALNLDMGKVYYACAQLTRLSPTRQMHLVLDNYATHRKVWAWREAHTHFHFTPTYASWLNSVEHWFNVLQRQVLAHSSFDSVRALQATLGHNYHAPELGSHRRRHPGPPYSESAELTK